MRERSEIVIHFFNREMSEGVCSSWRRLVLLDHGPTTRYNNSENDIVVMNSYCIEISGEVELRRYL